MGTINNYELYKDATGDVTIDVIGVPMYINSYVLTASTAKTITPPAGARYCIFSSTGNFLARYDGSAATVPSSDITSGGGSEINPVARCIAGITSFSIISPNTPIVSIAFYM
jgi:hypothetical protein